METTLRKIGNSVGVILPKRLLDDLNLKVGDKLNIESKDNIIRINPADEDFESWAKSYREANMEYKDVLRELAK